MLVMRNSAVWIVSNPRRNAASAPRNPARSSVASFDMLRERRILELRVGAERRDLGRGQRGSFKCRRQQRVEGPGAVCDRLAQRGAELGEPGCERLGDAFLGESVGARCEELLDGNERRRNPERRMIAIGTGGVLSRKPPLRRVRGGQQTCEENAGCETTG